ncbi:selenium-binding protein SBP56-related protein, partial [Rhizobium ruizarguesonis]
DVIGRYEIDLGPQDNQYDFWWNLPRYYMVSSEWALPPQFEKGIVPEDLLSNKYVHQVIGGADFQCHLVIESQINGLHVPAFAQIPEMHPVYVFV